jgi:hypothetical protein
MSKSKAGFLSVALFYAVTAIIIDGWLGATHSLIAAVWLWLAVAD